MAERMKNLVIRPKVLVFEDGHKLQGAYKFKAVHERIMRDRAGRRSKLYAYIK